MTDLVRREFSFDVEAELGLVWEALTTAKGLATWYVADATVDARQGGELRLDWGQGGVGMGTFEIFEAPHRLKLVYDAEVGAEEWLLSHDAGVTHVRLIHSLPVEDGTTWEDAYDGITRGWLLFHGTLMWTARTRERLGRRAEVQVGSITDGAWIRLLEALGLDSTPVAGSTVDLTETITAEVAVSVDDCSLLLTLDDRATLLVDVEGASLYTLSATYEDETPDVADLRSAIAAVAQRLCDAADS